MTIVSLEDLLDLVGPEPVILVERDPSCQMARITVDGNVVMDGNYWDFYPGCHGGWHYELASRHGSYATPEGMAASLAAAVFSKGAAASVMGGIYSYRG